MRITRRFAASVALALTLSSAMVTAVSAKEAPVAPTTVTPATTASISGLISPELRQYKTWRTKRYDTMVHFSGSVSNISCCFGQVGWGPAYWRMGLRNRSEVQFAAETFYPMSDSRSFGGTEVRQNIEFAINTRGYNFPASDGVASFSGTLIH